jgi:hypothetical protein
MNKPLDFIGVKDVKTGRVSSLGIYGRLGNGALTISGNLEHNAQIVPKSAADADRWIAWLKEWKEAQP